VNTSKDTEFVPQLLEFTEQTCKRAWQFAQDNLIEKEAGREVLGPVADRETTEDEYVEADRLLEEDVIWANCQELLEPLGIRVHVVSEHHPEGYGHENPNVFLWSDPVDGTDQLIKGILEAVYTVFSFTTPDGQPLVGGTVDLVAGILYLADAVNKKSWRVSLRTGKRVEVFPSQETELSGESVVVSYKGKWRYLAPWFMMVQDYLGRERFAGITHYSWGGSFVYALLAAGVFSIYIMMREPTDEIRPGRAFVAAAGLCLYSVTEGGVLRLFTWAQKKRVTFFIAAPNRELAQSVVDGIWGRDEEAMRQQRGWIARLVRRLSRPRMRHVNSG